MSMTDKSLWRDSIQAKTLSYFYCNSDCVRIKSDHWLRKLCPITIKWMAIDYAHSNLWCHTNCTSEVECIRTNAHTRTHAHTSVQSIRDTITTAPSPVLFHLVSKCMQIILHKFSIWFHWFANHLHFWWIFKILSDKFHGSFSPTFGCRI